MLVKAGHPVDAKPSLHVVVARRTPESRRLYEDRDANLAFEYLVSGRVDESEHRIRNVGVDMKGSRASGTIGSHGRH
jgi:hypothetical protein